MDSYRTITKGAEGIYKEKGSKFLAFALPVNSVEEVKNFLDGFRKEYYDARHVCYAYSIGADGNLSRSSDDGEPSGTAGRPILGQIRSAGVTNILIVVVRYFGGVLLGTGGLVTAYKHAAADAILHGEIVERDVTIEIAFSYDYIDMNGVMTLIKEFDLQPSDQQFDNRCTIRLSVPKTENDRFRHKLLTIESVSLKDDTEH
jgi:uncharacterized YigZ family protein